VLSAGRHSVRARAAEGERRPSLPGPRPRRERAGARIAVGERRRPSGIRARPSLAPGARPPPVHRSPAGRGDDGADPVRRRLPPVRLLLREGAARWLDRRLRGGGALAGRAEGVHELRAEPAPLARRIGLRAPVRALAAAYPDHAGDARLHGDPGALLAAAAG